MDGGGIRSGHLSIARCWACLLILPFLTAAALPPAPRALPQSTAIRLQLELVVNGAPTGRIVPVTQRDTHLLIAATELRNAGIALDPALTGEVDLSLLPGVQSECDQATQRLMLRVPDNWLPRQHLGQNGIARLRPESSFGAVLNYDFYASNDNSGHNDATASNEIRLFGNMGVIRSTGLLRISGAGRRFTRYDTNWTYVDDDHIRTYELGDLVTRTLSWSSAVRIGGAQISRDFSVRPDVITYPLPTFSGTSSVPTSVDLFINGYRASSGSLQPGPYTLNNIPYVNGAGEAVVTTMDAQGRQISTSIPFYVASTLLRAGLADYAFSVGKLRRNYGSSAFSYGATIGSGAFRYGLTDTLTVEAQAQFADAIQTGGIGAVYRLGQWGVFNASGSISRHDGRSGDQIVIGYQYQGRRFNLSANQIFRSRAFTDMSSLDNPDNYRLARRQTQVNANVTFGTFGTLGASYIAASQADSRFRLLTVSYIRSLWHSMSLNISAGHDFDRRTNTAMAQLVIPLGKRGSAAAGINRDESGTLQERLDYSRAVPSEGGLGWALSGARSGNGDTQYQASLSWRLHPVELQGGVYGSTGTQTRWGEASGSLVLMDGSLFAANRISDAFALVSTDHVAGVPVLYENQLVGKTDGAGHLLIPWATAYYGAKYGIDPLDLPDDVTTPQVEQRAAVKLGSGRLIRFPIEHVRAASILLKDAAGDPLKPGTPLTLDDGSVTYAGWGGIAYVQGLQPLNHLTATLPDGRTCSVSFPFDSTKQGIARIGPLTCQ